MKKYSKIGIMFFTDIFLVHFFLAFLFDSILRSIPVNSADIFIYVNWAVLITASSCYNALIGIITLVGVCGH